MNFNEQLPDILIAFAIFCVIGYVVLRLDFIVIKEMLEDAEKNPGKDIFYGYYWHFIALVVILVLATLLF